MVPIVIEKDNLIGGSIDVAVIADGAFPCMASPLADAMANVKTFVVADDFLFFSTFVYPLLFFRGP